jgi:hypothetical protein
MVLWLPTLIASLVWIPSLIGLGSLVRVDVPEHLRTGVSGLIGLAVLAGPALWLSLIFPVSQWIALGIYLAGLASLAWRGGWFIARIRQDGAVIGCLAVLVALQTPLATYDAGLYYIQAVEWIRSHPQVPGLANLHGRLGFNSAWFVVAAALELPWMRGGSALFLNGLPVILAGSAAAGALRQLYRGDRSAGNLLFALLALPSALGLSGIGSHATDYPVMILSFACFGLWALALDDERWRGAWGPALLLASMAFAVKSSAAVLLLGSVAVAWIAGWTREGTIHGGRVGRFVAGSASLLLPWTIRGFLASGCIAYPMVVSCVSNVPWATPIGDVGAMNDLIRSWARAPGLAPDQVLASWAWWRPWAHLFTANEVVRLLGWMFTGGAAAWVLRRARATRTDVILGVAAVTGVVFWWTTAPTTRFGLGYLVPLAALPGVTAFQEARPAVQHPGIASRALALVVAGIAIAGAWVNSPPGGRSAWPPLIRTSSPPARAARVHSEMNSNGVRVWVPDKGDQCWNAPLPCTPTLNPELQVEVGQLRIKKTDPRTVPGIH